MKRYEVREIDYKEMRRKAIYFADEIEIKSDDYGYFVNDKPIGQKVGFAVEGKSRKKWLHTVHNTMIQIIDNETKDVIVLKAQEQILEEQKGERE